MVHWTPVFLASFSQENVHNKKRLSTLRSPGYKKLSYGAAASVSIYWTALIIGNDHSRSIIKDEIPHSSRNDRTIMQLKNTISARTVTLTRASSATEFVNNQVILYGIPRCLLADIRLQYVSKFFAAVTAWSGTKHITTNAHHFMTICQFETFSRTVVTRIREYAGEHHTNWN